MFQLLLCDDEPHILRAAEIKFRRCGYEVTCVRNGVEAMEALSQQKPDALVTDCQMPLMNGIELVRKIRSTESLCDLPIVMLTAKGYELPQEELVGEMGVSKIMAKPFSPRALVSAIEALLPGVDQSVGQSEEVST
jgi:two-component system alkaline phosphatase synthesis response regulator PhoP